MAKNKTVATEASVEQYLAGIEDDARRQDCLALCALMQRVTKHPAKMWGPSIVGFGSYRYKYDSGREGEICLVGFASRRTDISLYGLKAAPNAEELLPKLGKHKAGKGCVSLRKLADIDLQVLEQLIIAATAQKPQSPSA